MPPAMRRHSAYERIATSLLALLVVTVMLLGWLAYIHDGMQFSAELRIEAPPGQVWDLITQPAKRTSWHAGVVAVLPLSGSGVGVGATSLVLYRDGGPTLEVEEEILAWEKPILWRVRQETEVFSSEIKITLSASGETSLITYREKKRLHPFVDRYMAPWLRWKGQRRLHHSMERLKLLAERVARTANQTDLP